MTRCCWPHLLAGLAALLLSACAVPQAEPLPAAEAEAFAAEVEPIVENMLVGLSEGDYSRHSRDFDDELRDQIDELVNFPLAYDEIVGTVGTYEAHTLVGVTDQPDGLRVATYDAAFSQDEHVTVRVFFRRTDSRHRIAGLTFDSEKLRAAAR